MLGGFGATGSYGERIGTSGIYRKDDGNFFEPNTSTGVALSVVAPPPSCPHSFFPQAQTVPSSAIAKE